MQSQNLRRAFLKYFKSKGHAIVPSSAVVPHDDPTLLFTNAGMNQFKDLFLGKAKRDYRRAASAQKCVRVGGKHNDLDNVGHTRRHLTFFEMLGNFSFGDYFKKEAIDFAWEVSTQVFGFDPEKIFPSVFETDDEAFELWTGYVPASRISRMGEKDNFWQMGEVGPCGPCSELYYDRGPSFGGAPRPVEDKEGERFLEFWNLVFMQYNKEKDGRMIPLPKPSIDTGAGLERIVLLQMGVDTVFETDILRAIIAQIEQVSGVPYDMAHEHLAPAFRVISDHLRTLAFAISDGVVPSNVDRGYVLRKVLRRAVRYGKTLGFEDPFLGKILPRLIETMGEDFPELKQRQSVIEEILHLEEESFFRTLKRGGSLWKEILDRSQLQGKKISGQDAFKLKDTYGFPIEEVLLLAKDDHLEVDLATYEKLEQEAKERSRNVQKTTHQMAESTLFEKMPPTEFTGYTHFQDTGEIIALVKDGQLVEKLQEGEAGMVLLNRTPFYAEMGGQVGDNGTLQGASSLFEVQTTSAPYSGIIAHEGAVKKGSLLLKENVQAEVNREDRIRTQNNHTATHLLHWALQKALGDHVKQAGSLVDPKRLRFDFSHHKALTEQDLARIEQMVNEKIRENKSVQTYELTLDEASKKPEIKQFFGEKYGSKVRVVDIDYSKELCGGTHTNACGTIGFFKIVKEGSIAQGVRRIEAVTGIDALDIVRQQETLLNDLSTLLKVKPEQLVEKVKQLQEEGKQKEKRLQELQEGALRQLCDTLLKEKQGPLLAKKVDLDAGSIRTLADLLFQKEPKLLLVLAGNGSLLIRIHEEAVAKGIKANEWLQKIAPLIEASGGGKPNLVQGAFKKGEKLEEAFALLRHEMEL